MMDLHTTLSMVAGLSAGAAVGLLLISEVIRKRRRIKARLWLVEDLPDN